MQLAVGQIHPSQDIILIYGGKTYNISQKSNLRLNREGVVSITDSLNKQQSWNLSKETMNKIIVPYGKITQVPLANNSKIWLNSWLSAKKHPIFS